jgi:hypothetical protein
MVNEPPIEPLFVSCEGSGGDLNPGGTCKMCHAWYPGHQVAPCHDRPDIIAMLKRGDYG